MLQNLCKTLGFKKNMVYKIPPGGGGKPYPASGLLSKSLKTVGSGRTFCVYDKTNSRALDFEIARPSGLDFNYYISPSYCPSVCPWSVSRNANDSWATWYI